MLTMIKLIRPRLVTFDVTNTLLLTKLEEHYSEIGSQHNLSVDPDKLAKSFKTHFQRLSLEHPIYGKHTGLGWENWWRTIVYSVFKDQNNEIPDTILHKVANNLIKCYSTSMCWHKYPGTLDLLEYLHRKGVILGVISNFDERLESILVDTEIRPYFSFILTSYAFGKEKPSLSIFEEALRLSKKIHGIDISSPEAMHIGDNVHNDYLGAKNAGWDAILITHGNSIASEDVPYYHVFRSLKELKTHFNVLLSKEQ